jgi:hypothetical protein
MSKVKKIRVTPSYFTNQFLYLKGKPFSFLDYEHMKPVYDINALEVVMKTSRQISKSTTMANLIISRAAMSPYFNQLYVSPSVDQTKVFSQDRVEPIINDSPFLKRYYLNANLIQNVFTKQLLNGSKIYLRYAGLTAERLRGFSTDINYYDETQNIMADHIPIINQSMSRSLVKKTVFAGTPLRTRGTLAELWYRSTMHEWFSKCNHCGKYNYLDHKNIGLKGPICRYCGRSLDTRKGEWVCTGDKESLTYGFRVNMLMFAHAPWINWHVDVILFRKNTTDAVFFNEVLGLEYDDGVQPITEADIRRCCTGGPMQTELNRVQLSSPRYMGLDYGPVNSIKSKTVVTLLQRTSDGKTQVLYAKKYRGSESDYAFIHDDVPRLFSRWGASVIGADAGLGDGPNAEIRKRIKDPRRLIAFRHSGSQKAKITWNKKTYEYILNRNTIMTEFFRKIKNQEFIFPDWKDFEPFARDLLSVAIEYDEIRGTYKYVNSDPDDALHSLLFGNLSLELAYKRFG